MAKEKIVGKIVIKGLLELTAPLLISDGLGELNKNNDKDMHVMKNALYIPFIPGTSLAGVLREYLNRQYPEYEVALFGDMQTIQSSIIIDDIELKEAKINYRDGVNIDQYTGVGIVGAKYDYEIVETGATGNLYMEITLRGYHLEEPQNIKSKIRKDIIDAILFLRDKMQDEIMIGAITTKGFGRAILKDVQTQLYDFADKSDVKAWLKKEPTSVNLVEKSNFNFKVEKNFEVEAELKINGSLIIRDYETDEVKAKDSSPISAVMLQNKGEYIIPGTSIKGVLRHQAEYIFDTLKKDKIKLEELMGNAKQENEIEDTKHKSRLYVEEVKINKELVMTVEYTRNRIDRFTGGIMDTALFTTKPIWQKQNKQKIIKLRFYIQDANEAEVGLALFLLKDIWQGKVAFGGEKSVGRGTLIGMGAQIKYKGKTWRLDEAGKVNCGNKDELNHFAKAFNEWK